MHLPVILRINKVTNQLISLCPIWLLMTGIDRYLTAQSTYSRDGDVFGHRGRCRARLLVPSLGPFNNADRSSSSRSSYDEAGWLSQDQQAMRLVPLPPGGALRGYHMFI